MELYWTYILTKKYSLLKNGIFSLENEQSYVPRKLIHCLLYSLTLLYFYITYYNIKVLFRDI